MKPALGKRAFIPHRLLDPDTVREAKRSLTFSEITADRVSHILGTISEVEDENDLDHYSYNTQKPRKVTIHEFREVSGGYSVPRGWAMENFPHLPWVDRTVYSKHNIKFTGGITPRDQRQAMFFENLLQAAETPGPQNILANSATGSGKTVAAIYLGWQLSTPTLIVVDSNKIAAGWLKNFRQFFGQGWTERNVGRVQQDQKNYEGKAFTIAMAQSIARRDYGQNFYRHFGLVIIDEVQVFGGPHFSPILYMFPARVRAYFTAQNRTGSFGRLIKTHTGQPRVVSSQEVLKPDAWMLRNSLKYKFYAANDGALLTNLAKVSARNRRLATLIKTRGYDRSRNVLVLSNRIFQLQILMRECQRLGVPKDAMGLHVGRAPTGKTVVYYKLRGSSKRNRLNAYDSESEAKHVINELRRGNYENMCMPQALYNRLQAGEPVSFESADEIKTSTQSELDHITHSCDIIFATYEIFSKGVDVPRLDMGVEALPAGNVTQPVGRVLRLLDGKAKPEWYAVHDFLDTNDGFEKADRTVTILNEFFEGKTRARIKALQAKGARIKWQK